MAIQYLDVSTGQSRLKRRYAWGLRGFALGLLVGATLVLMLN